MVSLLYEECQCDAVVDNSRQHVEEGCNLLLGEPVPFIVK